MGVPGMRTGGTRRARDASGGSVRHARPRGGGQSRELCGASGRLGCRGPCGARSCRSQPGAPCASYPRGESPPPHSAQSSVSCEVCSPHAALHMVPPVVHGPELRYTAVVGAVPWHFAGAESSECARFVCGARLFIGHVAHVARSSHFRAYSALDRPLAFAAPERGGWRRGLSLPLVGLRGLRKDVEC